MKEKQKHPIRNVMMVIEYDGTDYCGWQNQANGVTIQSVIEQCVIKMVGKKTHVGASGRTDSGVHALGQVANVKARFPVDDETLVIALNSMLPPDIKIQSARTVSNDFHAIKNAKKKTYQYMMLNRKTPSALSARTAWHVPNKLSIIKMRKAAKMLLGKHDFVSFMGRNSSVKTTVREIFSIEIRRKGDMIIFDVTGNGFLKHMVRIIVGTLVEIGKGRFSVDDMKKIIKARSRKAAGLTAPAKGLLLKEVIYQ